MFILVFLVVTLWGLVGRYQRFGRTYCCFHLQGSSVFIQLQIALYQKTNIDSFAVRTSDLTYLSVMGGGICGGRKEFICSLFNDAFSVPQTI
jgi:hypothetical protein